jgi:hypothetical protein
MFGAVGAISPDTSRWIPCRKSFFLPRQRSQPLLSQEVPDSLAEGVPEGQTAIHGELESLSPAAFEALCQRAGQIEWVVYARRLFGGPEQVLKYLAHYAHRVAVSNRRLLSLADGRVTFEWKDYADGNQTKTGFVANS